MDLTGSLVSSLLVFICTWIANETPVPYIWPGRHEETWRWTVNNSVAIVLEEESESVVAALDASLNDWTDALREDFIQVIKDVVTVHCEEMIAESCLQTLGDAGNYADHAKRRKNDPKSSESDHDPQVSAAADDVNPRTFDGGITIIFHARSEPSNVRLMKEELLTAIRKSQSDIGAVLGYDIIEVQYFTDFAVADSLSYYPSMTEPIVEWSACLAPIVIAVTTSALAIGSVGLIALYCLLFMIRRLCALVK